MSPKRAVAKPKAKAKAKVRPRAKAKARGVPRRLPLRRPAADVLRRPEGREPEEAAPERGSVEEEFKAGREVSLREVPISAFRIGARIIVTEGTYYSGGCQAAGRVREVHYNERGAHLGLVLTGTTNEDLLKFGTSVADKKLEVHICGEDCVGEPFAPALLHGKRGRMVLVDQEAHLSWEKNLEITEIDELAQLRDRQRADQPEEAPEKAKAAEKKKKKPKSSSSSAKDKRKKGKKKKEKKTKQKEENKESRSPEGSSEGDAKKKKKKKSRSYGGRTLAKKDPIQVYGGTGLDPKSRVRRKVAAYVKKRSKKKRESSSTSSSSSLGESGSTGTEEGADALQDQGRIRQMHRHGPGLLSSMALQRMRSVITEVEGIWNEADTTLAPVCLRYVRTQLGTKLSGAALKEAVTLGASIDLLAQCRPAEACDYLVQRLKSLEKISQGIAWQTSERLELAPGLTPQISSPAELQAARKEAKMEQDSRGAPSTWTSKGGSGKGGKKGKSDDKGKGKKKEGGGKNPPPPSG